MQYQDIIFTNHDDKSNAPKFMQRRAARKTTHTQLPSWSLQLHITYFSWYQSQSMKIVIREQPRACSRWSLKSQKNTVWWVPFFLTEIGWQTVILKTITIHKHTNSPQYSRIFFTRLTYDIKSIQRTRYLNKTLLFFCFIAFGSKDNCNVSITFLFNGFIENVFLHWSYWHA